MNLLVKFSKNSKQFHSILEFHKPPHDKDTIFQTDLHHGGINPSLKTQ
jgi:hypothetical protein